MATKNKIFTHCRRCETEEDTYTKSEVYADISNLLMYMRLINTTNRSIKNIRDRKDRLTDDKTKMVEQMEIDVKQIYDMIEAIHDKYTD